MKKTLKKKILKTCHKKLKYIFGFSSCFVFVLLSFYIYHLHVLNRNKKNNNLIAYNYKTLKLYANDALFTDYKNLSEQNYYSKKFVIGEIKILVLIFLIQFFPCLMMKL